MKLPFIEHTAVGISVNAEGMQWVEINRLGKRVKLQSFGEILAGKMSLEKALADIRKQLHSDAFLVACSFDDLLADVIVDDVPYFEETEEVGQWIVNRKETILEEKDEELSIQHHLVEVDEDQHRCIFQLVYRERLEAYATLFHELGLPLTHISTGVTEVGYSLIYEESFTEDVSGIIISNADTEYLSIYKHGLLQNLYEIGSANGSHVLAEADSYLRSEEASNEKPQGTIPIYRALSGENEEKIIDSREIHRIIPLHSKGFKGLSENYGKVCGLAVKLFFPDLDGFNFSKPEHIEEAHKKSDKKECSRVGALLLTPLILILLLLYAIEGVLDYKMLETSQVMEQIGDKIELVNQKTAEVTQSNITYKEVKTLLSQRENTAASFDLINSTIPEEVWLSQLNFSNSEGSFTKVSLTGYTTKDAIIANFMGKLEKKEDVGNVRLTGTQKVSMDDIEMQNLSPNQFTEFEIEVQVIK